MRGAQNLNKKGETSSLHYKEAIMKNILITGASSGFGELIARTLLQKGYTVAATMRHLESKNAAAAGQLQNVADETPGTLHLIDLDVTSDASVISAVDQFVVETGGIDAVVNNAGYGLAGFMEAATDEQVQRQFDVNVFGVQRVMRAVLPYMRRAKKGLVINISSIMGRVVVPFATAYTASKFALEGLSESYRYELAGTGVDVVLVEPGGFGTNFMAGMESGKDEERLEGYGALAELPDKMWSGIGENLQGDNAPNPEEIAGAVLNLIETPHGRRPLRTVVDPLMGGEAPKLVNQTTDKIQKQLLENLGFKELLSVKG